jgi:hypothetical protein
MMRADVEDLLPPVGDSAALDKFFQGFLDWDAQNSLTPYHQSLNVSPGDAPVRPVVGK